MRPQNLDKIQASFALQAETFESKNMSFSKQEYLDYTIRSIEPQKSDAVLEVASGTCACGRAMAPFAASVVCVDATPAMLDAGRKFAIEEGIENMNFINAFVEDLPFSDNSFDIVMTRLSFHHFTEMAGPFAEMHRVLKPGGKLVIIDMEAAQEELRAVEDRIETMRDPAHEKNRSKEEFLSLYKNYGYDMVASESTKIAVSLDSWLEHTKTPDEIRQQIHALMKQDLAGEFYTGFFPYLVGSSVYFDQRWLFTMGIKSTF